KLPILYKIFGLFGSQYNIGIVWKNKDSIGLNSMDSMNQIFCTWVHCLSAGKHYVNTDTCKNFVDSRPQSHSDKTKRLLFFSPAVDRSILVINLTGIRFFYNMGMLVPHILNLNSAQISIFHRQIQNLTRVFRMNMY